MLYFKYPPRNQWTALCERPVTEAVDIDDIITSILDEVRLKKDQAIFKYTKEFDKAELDQLSVNEGEWAVANAMVDQGLKEAIDVARSNIEKFHKEQVKPELSIETSEGVNCQRKQVPIEKVGLYVPGGTAPLFSTVLMLGIPAQIAGCDQVVLCTPPDAEGKVNPVILYVAHLLGIKQVFKVGGAQAIAGMAFGTESIPKVDKIFGPGNQYVTRAKTMVQNLGMAIDLPAGPSELLVVADETSVPEFVAADLLSQAEHGADSQVILLSNSSRVIQAVFKAVDQQLKALPRYKIADAAIKASRAILLDSIVTCLDFSNAYAPEHLILAVDTPDQYVGMIKNAGSVFLGNYSCESAGDYASGTNHTLPTQGAARAYSGVSVDSFVKSITFQSISSKGLLNIGQSIEMMAEREGLIGHKNAVQIRLKHINNEK